ncbi:MAG: FG-GAP-like repeat-containing protein, partial [Planctomycetota bacterium]
VGSHRVVIRATDPFGLFVEQTFDIEVVATLQNRPPNFVTDPVTEAIASSGFEVTTVGVGDSPAAAAVISGFRGPRIVTANSGDQTIGVYAGENSDRFDDVSHVSTGHPVREGQWVDAGTIVDFGAPAAKLVTDSYDISTYDHGDFNGDGHLDIVVGHHFDHANDSTVGTYKTTVLLNDGNGLFGEPLDLYEREIYGYQTYVRSVLSEDVNSDGHADVLFAEYHNGGTLFVSLGNGDGTFQPMIESSYEGIIIGDFVVEDIDGDGNLDLFGRSFAPSGFNRSLFWSRGFGDGTFELPNAFRETRVSGFRETSAPYSLSDLDGDGDLDFVISGDYPLIQVFHNDGAGEFSLVNEITPPNGYAFYGADWLTVGDFTGDGHDDVLLHHVWDGQLDLMVGDAGGINFTYQDGNEMDFRPDNWAMGYESMDVDEDGDLDIVFGAETGKRGVNVGLNDGTGHFLIREYFIPEVSTDLKIAYTDATVRGALFGDYNADGVMDVSYFTTDNNLSGQTDVQSVGILFGTRPGEFGRTRTKAWETVAWNDAAFLGDFSGDGIVDILDTASDVTALGRGDGTFGDLIPATGVRRPGAVAAVADYDNDGLDDVVSTLEGGLYVGLSNGDGTFAVNQNLAGGGFYGYNTIDPIDLNLDGYMDFVVKEEVGRYFEAYLNDPLNPGTFATSFFHSLGDGSQGVNVSNWEESWDVGDFTGDGIPDLITANRDNFTGGQVYVVVLAGDGEGGFTHHSELAGFQEERMGGIYGLAVEPGDFATGDIDNDGDLDLVAHSYLGARVLLNDGTGNFEISHWLDPVRTHQRGRESWLVDFDDDGNLDFVVAVAADIAGSFLFWRGDGEGNFAVVDGVNMQQTILGVREPFVDWDNDGHIDLVLNTTDDSISFYMGRRDDLVDMIAVDLNGDGNEEVIAVQEQMERLQIFAGDNLGGLTRLPDLQAGRAPKAVTAADLNGDGQLELLVANRAGRNISVYSGNLDDGYTINDYAVAEPGMLNSGPVDIQARDVDGDGYVDVMVLDDTANALWLFHGDGGDSLGQGVALTLGDRPGSFVIEDADGDDQLDAVITLPGSNRLMILSAIGSQVLGTPRYVELKDSPSDVAVLDLNDDGNPDLATTISGSNTLSIHYGLGNDQFARAQEIAVGDSPDRVVVTDADEDGRMDLVVTNAGDNTLSVIYNRFDPNEVYRYDSDAIDPDDDPLTYSIVEGPGGLIINSSTGALLWAASPSQVGVHDVTIAANDGRGGVATQSFKIEVEPARENSAPIIATTPVRKIGANEDFSYAVQAIDHDKHPLRYSLVDGPEGAIIDPTTGELTWDGRTQAEAYGVGGGFGYISVPMADSLKPESITMEGWFQFSDFTTWPFWREVFQEQGIRSYVLGDQTFRTDIALDGETIRLYHDGPAEVGRWTHIAVTYDAQTGTGSLYIDGHQVDSASFSTPRPLDTTPRPTNVGVGYPTYASIDSYRVWNVVRSESEILEGLTRNYENETSLILDYRFEDNSNYRSVRDHSIYGNTGYRVSNGGETQVAPGLTEIGSYQFTISVEDGRGGSDVQSFALDVVPELRGSLRGHLFEDLNGNGIQDDGSEEGVPAEPDLEGWHLWIDANGNAYPDPREHQTLTSAEGDYSFDDLLPGEYSIHVSPVAGYQTPDAFTATVQPEIVRELDSDAVPRYDTALRQLAMSQVRGRLQTEDGEAIAYWKVYADLDEDGRRGDDEPMATSDRDGNYSIAGLSANRYMLRTDLPAGWADAAGRQGITVTIGDDEVAHGNDFTLRPTNTSVTGGVHFVTLPPTEVEARETFTYTSIAKSIGNFPIEYDLSLAPDGMVIDATTGLVGWKPSIEQVGEHLVIMRATSEDGTVGLHNFHVEVIAPNTPPALSIQLHPSSAYVGRSYAINLAAQDAEFDEITYALIDGPATASLDPTSLDPVTGELRWQPTIDDVGRHVFTIELRDSAGGSSRTDLAVEVLDQQPSVTPFDITPVRSRVGIGQNYLAPLRGTDALGRPLSWTLVSGPAGLMLDANGTLRWTPGNSQLGSHSVSLEASSTDGETGAHDLTLQVVGHPENQPPSIRSQPHPSATIDRVFAYDLVANDPDLDVLAYALLEGPAGMSVHPSEGTLRWTPSADQRGEQSVTLQVTDPDGMTDEQTFDLAVSSFGGPPKITSLAPTEGAIGSGYLYTVAARDAEGDPLDYRLLTAPAGMTITETTGEISWTPTANQLGNQDVVIEVSDGIGGAATQAFSIRVSEGVPNQPPQFVSAAPRFGSVSQLYGYTAQAADPEQTSVTYSLGQAPAGMTIDAVTGDVRWTPTGEQAGQFVVTIFAADEGGATAVESFELDILSSNNAPTLQTIADVEAVAGARFRLQVFTDDADRDPLGYELVSGPSGASIDAFGRLDWSPTLDDLGSHDFEVRVSDPRGGQATRSFSVIVIEDFEGPRVSLIETPNDASRNILPWQGPFIVFAKAIDDVAVASLTLSANGHDIPLDAAGRATFPFDEWFFETITATATATDTSGNVTTRTISFNYDVPEGWSTNPGPEVPTAIITSPADNGTAVGMVSITGTADHEDFGAYTLSYRRADETSFTEFHRSTTPVVDGELGVWDTSLLLNDEYVIRLQVATTEGTANVAEHRVGLAGDLKLGNFRLSFTDMVIPVAGIPIEITRIYDTLQADREGDFGYGWRLEYRDTYLRVGLPESGLEDIGIYSALRPGVKVFLNVPGQGRQGFTFNPDIRVLPGWGGNNLVLARPRFTPDPGVTSTLATGTSGYLQVNELGELYAPGGIPYNPASPDFGGAYVVTTRDGITYRVDGASRKLTSATDRNGNQIEFREDGLFVDDLAMIEIRRNGSGQITSLTALNEDTIRYIYENDRLTEVVEVGDIRTTIDYEDGVVSRITDPLGRAIRRLEYNDEGRLIRAFDAEGREISYDHDPDTRQEVVTDDRG